MTGMQMQGLPPIRLRAMCSYFRLRGVCGLCYNVTDGHQASRFSPASRCDCTISA